VVKKQRFEKTQLVTPFFLLKNTTHGKKLCSLLLSYSKTAADKSKKQLARSEPFKN